VEQLTPKQRELLERPIAFFAPGRGQKVLLVGEAPNEATAMKPHAWLSPDKSGIRHSANRLLEYMGFSFRDYLVAFDRANLLHYPQPREAKGRGFIREEARLNAERLKRAVDPDRHVGVILLGTRVARAWGLTENPHRRYFYWHVWNLTCPTGQVLVAVVPHPSGANRWWNDPANREDARRFFVSMGGML